MSVMIFVPEPKKKKIEMFHCTFCKQSFYYERYLKRHIRRMHDDVIQCKVPQKVHKCNLCEKSFSSKSYMYRHSMNTHGMSAKRTSIKCQEENCNDEFSTLARFRVHLDSIHNFADYNMPDKLRFNSFADYIEWLVAEEKNTKCKFIRPRGRFKRNLYTGIDYTCSQNRYFFSKTSEQSIPKTQDSTKIRCHCTAQILVKEYNDHVEALYFKRHYKHDFAFSSPRLFIRRKKIKKVEKKMDILANVCETTFSLTDEQYPSQSEDTDITNISLCNSKDIFIESVTKRLDIIHSKLLSKTSIDMEVALKISESLQIIEGLLDNDTLINNIESSSKVKDKNCELQQKTLFIEMKNQTYSEERLSNSINIPVNEIFVSTSPANDHDYD